VCLFKDSKTTSPKGFSASKCDEGNWLLSKSWNIFGIFLDFLGEFFMQIFSGEIFGRIFWEDFFGGILWEELTRIDVFVKILG
jgi:hypothetical protein